MKNLLWSLIVLTLLTLINACSPYQEAKWNKGSIITVTQVTLPNGTTIPVSGGCEVLVCTTLGNNCKDLGMGTSDGVLGGIKDARLMLNDFYFHQNNNTLATFFSNYNWELLFPELYENNSVVVNNIVNGLYKVEVLKDSSIVILGNPLAGKIDDNIVFSYTRNDLDISFRANPCGPGAEQ